MTMLSGMMAVSPTAPAQAAGNPVTLRVDGVVDLIEGVDPSGAFAVGSPFSITYRFDADAADSWAPIGYGIYNAVESVSAEIGNYTITGVAGQIYVTNDQVSGTGQNRESYGASFLPVDGAPIGVAEPYLLSLNLQNLDSDGSVFADESLPDAALDLASFPTRFLALEFDDPTCDFGSSPFDCPLLLVTASIDAMTLVVDGDGDGVADSIGTGIAGSFDDGNGTSGNIANSAELDVLVQDADPGGVRITATGTGGPAVIQVCGFTIAMVAGSDATITCGSVTVEVVAGEVTVTLSGSDRVTIPEGGSATIDRSGSGTVSVDNFGSTPVEARINGSPVVIGAGTTVEFPPDADGDGVVDDADVCPGTALPDEPTHGLKGARFAAQIDGTFDSGNDKFDGLYTLADTGGCSGSQIIELERLGNGHAKFGISKGNLEAFIAGL
jgi:hypothetical protein